MSTPAQRLAELLTRRYDLDDSEQAELETLVLARHGAVKSAHAIVSDARSGIEQRQRERRDTALSQFNTDAAANPTWTADELAARMKIALGGY